MQINHPEKAEDFFKAVTDYRTGNRSSAMLLTGREGPANYRLNVTNESKKGSGDWTTPRHRHTKEQFRLVLDGEYHITDTQFDRGCNGRGHNPSRSLQGDVEPCPLITAPSQTPLAIQLATSREGQPGADGRHNLSHHIHGSHLPLGRDRPDRTDLSP